MIGSVMRPSRWIIAAMVIAAVCALGCSSGSSGSLSASFTASGTPTAANLIKLIQKSKSGSHVIVQAVIYGPTTSQDLYTFAFDVAIGDPTIVKFVSGSAVAGTALTVTGGQTISAIADLGTLPGGGVDNSRVVVGVSKLGGGLGNGVAGASAVVVELTFATLKSGTTTLTLTGSPNPQVLDHNGAPIGSITFDAADASMTGVMSSGGGY